MQILVEHHQRLLLGERQSPGDQRLHGLLALQLGALPQRRVAIGERQREQRGDERHHLGRRELRVREPRLEPTQLALGIVVRLEPQSLLDELDQRVEGAPLAVGRAAALEPAVGRRGQPLAERLQQARLAEARLARDQHRLPIALLRLLPAGDQQPQLLVAPDQRGEHARVHVEAAAHTGRLQHGVGMDRRGDALERRGAEIVQQEHARDEPLRGTADHHRVGRGHGFEARGDVRRVAEGEHLALGAAAHRADHHRAGVDADARRQTHPVLGLERIVQRAKRGEDLEPGTHGAFGVVLVGLRIAEVHEQPVAQILGDVPRVAVDRPGRRLLIGAHDAA